ncbi:hypothetical protein B9S53_05470 [Arthrospira sp. O9.13F]|nr:hypothetical protein B9S53_05470 [Arthrospira sp. O9.13F]
MGLCRSTKITNPRAESDQIACNISVRAIVRHQFRAFRLGVESEVAFTPSHSEPYMRLSPHTAPSLTASLLRVQQPLFIKSCFIIVTVAM